MVYNPDGSQLAVFSGTRGGVVHVWDLVAIRNELRKRDLDWSSTIHIPVSIENDAAQNGIDANRDSKISGITIRCRPAICGDRSLPGNLNCCDSQRKNLTSISARAAIAKIIETPTSKGPDLQQPRLDACKRTSTVTRFGYRRRIRPSRHCGRIVERGESRSLPQYAWRCPLSRQPELQEAIGFLEQSLAIQPPRKQPFDLYFLSMCSARLGDAEKAREYFDRAESLVEQHQSHMPSGWRTELALFADEAKQLLK